MSLLMIRPGPQASFDRLVDVFHQEINDVEQYVVSEDIGEKLTKIVMKSDRKWEEEPFLQVLYDKPYKIFVWKEDSLIFWNHNRDLSFQNINKHKSDFHYGTREILSPPYRVEILYPFVGAESHFVNRALLKKSSSNYDFIHVKSKTEFSIRLNKGESNFYLKPIKSRLTRLGLVFSFLMYGFSLVFFLIHYSVIAVRKANESNKLYTIGFYLLGLISIKLVISFIYLVFVQSDLIVFSSSNSFAFYKNIADFLLSSLFIFIGVISLTKILSKSTLALKKGKRYWLVLFQWSIIVGFLLIISASRGLVLDTNMHFNVEEVYHIDKYSLLCITAVLFMLFSLFKYSDIFSLYSLRFGVNNLEKVFIFILSFIASLPVFYYLDLNISIYISYGFITIYFLLLDMYMDNRNLNISWLIFWMILFSGFTSVVFYNYSLEKEIVDRKELILSMYNLPANEDVAYMRGLEDSLLSLSLLTKIQDQGMGLRQFDMIQYFTDELNIDNPLLIERFDREGNSLFLNHSIDENRFLSTFVKLDSLSGNLLYDPFTEIYLLRFIVPDTCSNASTSYFQIDLKNKGFYKKLERAFKNNSKSLIKIVEGEKNLFNMGNFDPLERNGIVGEDIEVVMGNGQLSVGYSPRNTIQIISFKKIAGIIKPISFFSYIFSLIGLLILATVILHLKYDFLALNMNFDIRHSLRLKIQFTLLVMIIVSFLLVGVITSFYFQNLIKKDQLHDIKDRTNILRNSINSLVSDSDGVNGYLQLLKKKTPELAQIHNTELLLFSKDARWLNSSNVAHNGMMMDYAIWFDSKNKLSNHEPIHQLIKNAQWESYIPIYKGQQFIGSMNVKHPRLSVLNNSILDFFSTLLNVYVFLFLLAGFIAIVISNSITRPLRLLATKIDDLKLGKQNESIPWKGNDEIGLLIKNYNEMLTKIDNSAQMLAKTQRDQAWREMAKQVAHEIKNPLTPMKLSMQYLEKMVKDNPDRVADLVPRFSKTLIEQIDNLSGIASAFSNFAKMPKATNQKVLLNDVVETTHDLFRERDDIDIRLIEPIDDLYVFADKNHLVRILNNLLKNAMQAIPEEKRGKITIDLYKSNELAIIKITDNGSGISDDMLDKVFTPNFTTKSSGTGLGLPIVANMIETFNGRIYFETELGVGTSFFVEIPTMRTHTQQENTGERISLD